MFEMNNESNMGMKVTELGLAAQERRQNDVKVDEDGFINENAGDLLADSTHILWDYFSPST